ncbi:MFS transporter [Novosphingobium resinovorum]|uniref:MFS transporter n=1 Tax=Novosphingobium resinovorum TaxID=158500 RepID=UPI002ED2E265|nr:MFS transporter [Novosphingobium resinovorum]
MTPPAAVTADTASEAQGAPAAYPPLRLCLGFGVGTSGISILLNTVSVYFPALMATVLGVNPAVAGTLVMLSKIYDAVADVVIGQLSDKWRARMGRRPFLLAGALVSFVSLLMIFLAPPMSGNALIAWMAVGLVIYSTGYSLFNVPYLTMPSEITSNNAQRLRLISFRTAFIGVGQLTALALSAWLIQLGGGGRIGYLMMGGVMAVLALATMLGSWWGTRGAKESRAAGTPHRLSMEDFRSLLDNRPLFVLLGAKLCQYVAFGVLMPITLLFLLNVMSVGYTGMIHQSVVQNGAVFLSMPAWTRIGRRIGKRNAYLLAQVIMIPAVISWFWADAATGYPGIWWRSAVFGFASGGALLMSTSMLPDTIEFDRLKNGLERGGVFASLYSVNEKLGFAIGALVLGWGLSIAGYVATKNGALVEQSARTIAALYAIKTTVPAAMLAVGAALLLLYDLDEDKLERLRAAKGGADPVIPAHAGTVGKS